MQDAASYVLLKGKTASPLQNNSEKVKYFCRYQIKGALPLHRANISLGCHATGAQVLKSLTSFYWKPKSLPTSTKIREFTRRGMVYSIFVMQRITLPCRRPIAAVPDNLTGCLGVPWGLMWLQELWGQQGHAVRWQIHITWCLPKMQEVDIMDSKVLIFLRHLGYDTESQRVRNGCYLIFSTDSLKWQKRTYLTFVLCWPGVIFHTRKQEGCPPALVQCPIWHSCLGDAVCHLCFLACIPRTCQSRPELYSKEKLIIIIEKVTYLADVFCITRFLKNAKFSD